MSVDAAMIDRYVRSDQLDLGDLLQLADVVEQATMHSDIRYRSRQTRHAWVAAFMLRYEILVRARAA